MSTTRESIYAIVSQIPRGQVSTYGQVARLAGLPGQARQVGYALAALPAGREVPWHRVVNARGEISARADPLFEGIQRDLLAQEGVVFGVDGRIPLSRHLWAPASEGSDWLDPE